MFGELFYTAAKVCSRPIEVQGVSVLFAAKAAGGL